MSYADEGSRIVWVGVGIVLVIMAVAWIVPKVEDELAPELVAAHVAIAVEGEPARVGRVHADTAQAFRVYAVLEARRRDGSALYYTEAPALEIEGKQVPPNALKRWDRSEEPRILWFTVESSKPYQEIESIAELEAYRFDEVFQADWPRTWSTPGVLRAGVRRFPPEVRQRLAREPFGTQRFHLRIELFDAEGGLTPKARYASLGAEAVNDESFPSVMVALSGSIAEASMLFRLPQFEPVGDRPELRKELLERTRSLSGFSRLTLLSRMLERHGVEFSELTWLSLDLVEQPVWADGGVMRGDLLRVGARVVVLYDDLAPVGTLDRTDLCFDFDRGFSISSLGEVFAETGGVLEWAGLE